MYVCMGLLTAQPWAERGSCFPGVSNRAAMSRARSLLCTFFFNRATKGRARFLLCTGFIINRGHGPSAVHVLPVVYFFNRAAMGRARFMFYPLFIFLTARPWAERGSCFRRFF